MAHFGPVTPIARWATQRARAQRRSTSANFAIAFAIGSVGYAVEHALVGTEAKSRRVEKQPHSDVAQLGAGCLAQSFVQRMGDSAVATPHLAGNGESVVFLWKASAVLEDLAMGMRPITGGVRASPLSMLLAPERHEHQRGTAIIESSGGLWHPWRKRQTETSLRQSSNYLFTSTHLRDKIEERQRLMQSEVEGIEENRFLNTSPDDLADYFSQRFAIEPVVVLRDEMSASSDEIQIDVRHDSRRMIFDSSRPVLIPGQRVTVHVPFRGDETLLNARANQYDTMPPSADFQNNEIRLRFDTPHDSQSDLKAQIDRVLSSIETYLKWQMPEIERHNGSIRTRAAAAIQERRSRLLKASETLGALGIPIRVRGDAPKTYAVRDVRRSAIPALPPATSKPFSAEPAWAMEHYEHALKVMELMTHVIERSPDAFKKMNEEDLRQHFLVQLNAQFEGRASGETFNMGGKTDILLRHEEKNVFIAECKFWKGSKHFSEAIDQLLSYTTWRDTKTVILVFNRKGAMSVPLKAIPPAVEAHPNYKRTHNWPHETGFRYTLHNNGDTNREILVTVLVFDVPS